MKLQIDTQLKKITICSTVTLYELNEFIRLAIPESEYKNWTLESSPILNPTSPIVLEDWQKLPWKDYYPWWETPTPQPIWIDPQIGQPPFVNQSFIVELRR